MKNTIIFIFITKYLLINDKKSLSFINLSI